MRISKQVHVEGRYHVAIMNPHERSAGAALLPVVCWMVVTTKDEEGDPLDSIVPFVISPDNDDGALMPATLYDEDDFIAIVAPGEEIHGVFGDVANERLKIEQEADNREDKKDKVRKAYAALNGHQLTVLKNLNVSDHHDRGVAMASTEDLLLLVTLSLIAPSQHGDRVRWYTTALGTDVCHFERRPVHAELPEVES